MAVIMKIVCFLSHAISANRQAAFSDPDEDAPSRKKSTWQGSALVDLLDKD